VGFVADRRCGFPRAFEPGAALQLHRA
jgi:hypothetical protein